VERTDTDFPPQLLPVRPEVKRVWWRGRYECLQAEQMVAVVGSRRMTQYGKQVVAELIPRLVESGYVVISGCMYGVDIEVHRLTMSQSGCTIAALGWGINYKSDVEKDRLLHKIVESGGLVISELGGEERGQRYTFPRRNRIMAGLAERVIVVEADEESGSLNTVGWAKKYGKQAMAVPGSVFSLVSRGTNGLIGRGQAEILTWEKLENWLRKDGNTSYSEKRPIGQLKIELSEIENMIVTQLKISGTMGVSELVRSLTMPVGQVGATLTSLKMKGLVAEERGVWRRV